MPFNSNYSMILQLVPRSDFYTNTQPNASTEPGECATGFGELFTVETFKMAAPEFNVKQNCI